MNQIDYRRADGWTIGEELREVSGGASHGTIVSIRNCPHRITMAYMAVIDQFETFTIYSLLRDAKTSPVIARRIPWEILVWMAEDIRIYVKEHKMDQVRKPKESPKPVEISKPPPPIKLATGGEEDEISETADEEGVGEGEELLTNVPEFPASTFPAHNPQEALRGDPWNFTWDSWFLEKVQN